MTLRRSNTDIDIRPAIDQATRQPLADTPRAFVFANSAFRPLLQNWIQHATRGGFSNIFVFALDEEIASMMASENIAHAMLPFAGSRTELWILRARIFAALGEAGMDFIHSDADAVWLKNPLARIRGLDADLVFSQGSIWPPDVAADWGFVLCCGFFYVRGTPATANFFKQMSRRIFLDKEDQTAINRTLRDLGVVWNTGEPKVRRMWEGTEFFTYDAPIFGVTRDGLTTCMLPHREFTRLPERSDDTYVAHPILPPDSAGRMKCFHDLRLWAD